MNLKEFINHRSHCPICDAKLETKFISLRSQKTTLTDNKLSVLFNLKTLKNSLPDYQVIFDFDIDTGHFAIEFRTEWDHTNQVPMHLIEKFREFYKNVGDCRFIRCCERCERYFLYSNKFTFKLSESRVGDLELHSENFSFTVPANDGVRIIGMFNQIHLSRTELCCWNGESEEDAKIRWLMWSGRPVQILPLIPFVSKQETTDRLNNLIIFS